MDGELNQNLPTTPRKKPIFIVKHSTRSINAKSQKKEGDRDHHFEERTHPKRIKYNNSNNYYVTDDVTVPSYLYHNSIRDSSFRWTRMKIFRL